MPSIIKYGNTKLFKKIVDSIKSVLNESTIVFTNEYIRLCSFDLSKVCVVELKMFDNQFLDYDVPETEEVGLQLEELSSRLNWANDENDDFTLEVVNKETMAIKFKKSNFNMKLKTFENEDMDMPDTPQYIYKFDISTKEFHKAIKNLSDIGDTCKITMDEQSLSLTVTGDSGTGSFTFDDLGISKSEDAVISGPIDNLYNLKYLLNISKSSVGTSFTIYFSKENPICLEFIIESQNAFKNPDDYSYIRFYLAHKYEE